jgi:SAM-dependent methyltransferase
MVTAGHLGGYITGGDPATTYPDLWRWLVEEQGVRSVLDVGCGDGTAVKFFEGLGCRVFGIDGVPQEYPAIVAHDFTVSAYRPSPWPRPFPVARFDLCWSCEFVEHVEEWFMPNYLDAFRYARLLLLTHALPGQGGWHHVNERPREFWVGALAAVGFHLDELLTGQARELAARNEHPLNYFVRTGLAFRRHE